MADTLNNRILGFKDFTHMQNGQAADIVIGQPDLFRVQINYPTNDPTKPNQQGLHGPTSLVVDSAGNLYVADTFNSRILRFPTPFNPPSGSTVLESADLVLGQTGFRFGRHRPHSGNDERADFAGLYPGWRERRRCLRGCCSP